MLLIQEVVAYAKTAMSRRKYLLHYFGEEWDDVSSEGASMDDNSRNLKKLYDSTKHVQTILNCIDKFNELHKAGFICKVIAGVKTSEVTMYKGHLSKFFGDGSKQDKKFLNAVVHQMYVRRLLTKEIETYGILKITNVGRAFMKNPTTFKIVKEEEIGKVDDDELIIPKQGGGAVDEVLFGLPEELCAKNGIQFHHKTSEMEHFCMSTRMELPSRDHAINADAFLLPP
jgi:ATP-dependent DNA helicase RecQ